MADLKGADEWLNRAKEHLAAFQETSAPLVDSEIETMIASFEADPNLENLPYKVPSLTFRPARGEAPLRFGVLIGEFIQALRRCLDYLVYELATLDSGSEQEGTQFPIEDTQEGFQRRRKASLRGVAPGHTRVIEGHQPYNGVHWTKTLRAISNPDKHRHLTLGNFSTSERLCLPENRINQALAVTRTKDGFTAVWNPDNRVQTQLHFSVFMAFEDGTAVYETLDQIRAEVGDLLEGFRPCFSGQCRHL
jgi:hypothetical protein